MNELIEHLAERATKEMDQEAFSEDMNIPAEWYHKFAELIVAECTKILADNSEFRSCVIIGKHFKVEE